MCGQFLPFGKSFDQKYQVFGLEKNSQFEIAIFSKVFLVRRIIQSVFKLIKYVRTLRALNQKEIQLNLCNVFSIIIFNELSLFA